MSDLTRLTLAEARDGLAAKKFSAAEINQAFLDAMARAKGLNAYIVETPEKALAMAKASDDRIAKGESGPLEGVPLGIKDLYATEGVQTTAASHILEGFTPRYESSVTTNLWRDGATMLGKLNLDEFAMGSSNETSYFGPVVSPWRRNGSDAKIVPGAPRAARRRRSRRGSASAQRRPTPAARSASRRPLPARLESSRPTAAARAGALSLSPPRSIRLDRSPRMCATRRSCCARWPGTIRRTPPASMRRCPITRRPSAPRSRAR